MHRRMRINTKGFDRLRRAVIVVDKRGCPETPMIFLPLLLSDSRRYCVFGR